MLAHIVSAHSWHLLRLSCRKFSFLLLLLTFVFFFLHFALHVTFSGCYFYLSFLGQDYFEPGVLPRILTQDYFEPGVLRYILTRLFRARSLTLYSHPGLF